LCSKRQATVHPFDVRTVIFAKHAQHVVLIHFPIALFIAGVLFDFLAQWTKRQGLAAAAYCNFLVAAIATVPTIITGLLAWQWQLEGQRLKGVLLLHLILACVSSLLICAIWWIHQKAKGTQRGILPGYRLPIEVVAVAIVTVTGHLGGFLSGVNGPG